MTDLESSKPLFEASVKLCAAVKKHKCLHGPNSYHKYTAPECSEAWELVAEECNETVDFCKKRWKTLRRCFFQGLKRRGNNYYLHEHLKFLQEGKKKTIKNKVANLNDETNSSISDTLQKCYEDNCSLQGSEMEAPTYGDDDDKSFSSQTTSADESNENISQDNEMGVFIINELEEETDDDNKGNMDDRRSSFRRSCKRSLDPNVIDELTEEEPEEKRSRKEVTEKRKTLKSENDSLRRDNPTHQSTKNHLRVRVDKLKINIAENKVESVKGKMVDRFTFTDLKQTRDFGTQYDLNSLQFDDSFMQTIRIQLHQMNARQKMNFKRKVYQSLLEVFDDATDFPNANEILPLPNKQAPRIVNTTVGELRLMRELVSLVQAAKNTPEIVNAKDKVVSSTPVQSKPPLKMPLPIVGNRPKGQALPPISISPTPDDDDLHFSVDNTDEEDDVSLPRSWNEIKTKPIEPPKTTTEDKVAGVPRRVLQKVVRVSGSNGSTIVTRDGDKKRVYRIYPKAINPNEERTLPTKNNHSFGTFFMSPPKTCKDTKNDNNVGTLFTSSSKNLQDTATSSNNKINISSSSAFNTTVRSFNDKPTNGTNETVNSVNKTNQQTISNNINNNINSQTIFKNVHPANRILSPTTGFFKIISTPKTIQKPTSVQPTGAATNSASTKLMLTKLPVNPMLPPVPNVATKRTQLVRPGTQISQRRYSICGALPAENTSAPNSAAAAASKSSTTTKSNGNPQTPSNSISQIQISQPVSLNSKATNAQTSSNGQIIKTNSNTKTTDASTKDIKLPVKSFEQSGESIANKGPKSSDTKARQIPILETAGTVEADILDPLFVKPLIKSEPLDE